MPKYSIATQWNTDAMLEIVEMFNGQHQLNDVCGSLSHSIIGHGRASSAVPDIDFKAAKTHIDAIQNKGIIFNYLFNGAFDNSKLLEREFYHSTLEYIKRVIEGLEISYVTVAVPELINIINLHYPQVSVKVSTIFNVLSVDDLNKLENLKFARVALGNDAPRNPKRIKEMLEYCKGRNVDLELMLTETCLYKCKTRAAHYQSFSSKSPLVIDRFMSNCVLERILHPEEFLKSCWIRPENLKFYCDLGINNFKISGRSKSPEWTKKCISAYINENYDGNIMEIFGTTPPNFENSSEQLFFLDNKSLQYFIEHHPMDCYDKSCQDCNYCEETATALIESGKLSLNKYCGKYKIAEGRIVCEPGPYIQKLKKQIKSSEY